MDKNKLERFIGKYSLGNAIPSVNWVSNGNSLFVKGLSEGSDAFVSVTLHENALPEGTYGVFDTHKLSSMLSVLNQNVTVDANTKGDKKVSIVFKDTQKTVINYALADANAIPVVPDVQPPPAFDLTIFIDKEFIASYLKATSALSEVEQFTVVSDGTTTQVVIGHSNNNTNKITLDVQTASASEIQPISFSAKFFREMLSANRNCVGTMKINTKGIAHVAFKEEGFDTNYYLIVNSNSGN